MRSTGSQTLTVEECNEDPAQILAVNENPMAVSNVDGNCITLGRAALRVEVRVFVSIVIRNVRVNEVVRCCSRFHLRRARMRSNLFSSRIQSLRNQFEGWMLETLQDCYDVKQRT